jgi:short-subunit dehydrogenase
VAVVSGGSRGIGKAIALRLAEEGADLVISARNEAALGAAAKQIADATGRRVESIPADLSTLVGCQDLHREATSRFDQIDILVNCAGATKSGPFLELADEIWQEGFDLKFFGAVRLSRLFWPQLAASRGSVVHIVGGMARTPNPTFAIGGAVNAALANFGKALAGIGLIDDVIPVRFKPSDWTRSWLPRLLVRVGLRRRSSKRQFSDKASGAWANPKMWPNWLSFCVRPAPDTFKE